MAEIKELNTITTFILSLMYHKYSNYTGPYTMDNDEAMVGADFTFVDDKIIFTAL